MVGTGALAVASRPRARERAADPQRAGLGPRSRQGDAARSAPDARTTSRVAATDDLQGAVNGAHVICCATPATEPLLRGHWLPLGVHIDLVGGFTPAMREADDETMRRARIFVDTREGALAEAGDIVQPMRAGAITEDDIAGDLFELARGDRAGRRFHDQITRVQVGGRRARGSGGREARARGGGCHERRGQDLRPSSEDAVAAAVAGGARFVGFVFYPPSPRHLDDRARQPALARAVPAGITRVAVSSIPTTIPRAPSRQSADRPAAAPRQGDAGARRPRSRTASASGDEGVAVAGEADLDAAKRYFGVADWLMFDAKPPKDKTDAMPGGNALAFDWQLLRAAALAAALDAVGRARPRQSRRGGDDLARRGSSMSPPASRSAPGVKDPAKIRAFLARAGACRVI